MTHGTTAGYRSGCKCTRCMRANADYARDLRRRKRDGEKLYSTPHAARKHIRYLMSTGMSERAISDACGIAPVSLRHIRRGEVSRVYKRTEDAILGVSLTTTHSWPLRILVGYMQRARFSNVDIERAMNVGEGTLGRLLANTTCHPSTVKKAKLVYLAAARKGLVPSHVLEDIT